jgi:adenylate cyclase
VAKTSRASIENVEGMIGGVAATLRLLAQVTVRKKSGLAAHRAVTRIDDDRRRSDPRIPRTANWHSNFYACEQNA